MTDARSGDRAASGAAAMSVPTHPPAGQAQPTGLERLGRACAGHPRRVIAIWLALLVVSVVLSKTAGGTFSDKVELPGTQAATGLSLLEANEPSAGGYPGQVVFHTASVSLHDEQSAIEQSVSNLRGLEHVVSASDPLAQGSVSPDGRTSYSTVHFDQRPKTFGSSYVGKLEGAVAPARAAGVTVEFGSGLDELLRPPANDALSEVIGFTVALLVLLVGFGSVAGAVLPLVSALIAVAVGVSLLGLAAALVTFGTTAPTLALMIGLGVGIDYALFLTTRFRQQIADGADPVHAAGRTTATSGFAVLVAAGTVSLALLGLFASGITFIGMLGLAAVLSVLSAAAASLTLVPAALGMLGRRIDALTVRAPIAESGSEGDGWHRYARLVGRHPWRFLVLGLLVLAVLTVPLLSIELGHIDDGADPHSDTDRRAYDLIAQGFGAGANGPLTIVVDSAHASRPESEIAKSVEQALAGEKEIARYTPLKPSANGALLIGTAIPASSPQSHATSELFQRLVDTTLPDALAGSGAQGYVTGGLAGQLQFTERVISRLPVVIAVVVALAFLLLMVTFRSLLIAVKAAVLNLLSIGAAYGVLVAVFQWGWGSSSMDRREGPHRVLRAGADVRDRFRALDGLRGVPALADQGGMGAKRRQHPGGRGGLLADRARVIRRGADHGERLHLVRPVAQRGGEDARGGPGGQRARGRHDRQADPRACHDNRSGARTGGCRDGSSASCPGSTRRAHRSSRHLRRRKAR